MLLPQPLSPLPAFPATMQRCSIHHRAQVPEVPYLRVRPPLCLLRAVALHFPPRNDFFDLVLGPAVELCLRRLLHLTLWK